MRYTARAGTFAFVPRDTIHGFHNAGKDNAILLVVHHPSGFEPFLEGMQQLAARQGSQKERAALAAHFRYDSSAGVSSLSNTGHVIATNRLAARCRSRALKQESRSDIEICGRDDGHKLQQNLVMGICSDAVLKSVNSH
jgi:hypothetical protein